MVMPKSELRRGAEDFNKTDPLKSIVNNAGVVNLDRLKQRVVSEGKKYDVFEKEADLLLTQAD